MRCWKVGQIAQVVGLVLCMGAFPGVVVAHDGHSDPEEGASIRFTSPADGAVLNTFNVEVTVLPEETIAGALDDLDHIHWGMGLKGTQWEPNMFTMPDLRGDSYFLGDEAQNGEYEICAYLARADHSHLSEMACLTVIIAVSGADLLLPNSGAEYASCDVPLNYSFFSHTNTPGNHAARVRYSIDGGEETVHTESSLAATMALSNGEHTLSFQAEEEDGDPLGEVTKRTFEVNSPMSPEASCEALHLARRGKVKRKLRSTKSSAAIVLGMEGACKRYPGVRSLSNRKIRKLITLHKEAIREHRSLAKEGLRLLRRQCRGK